MELIALSQGRPVVVAVAGPWDQASKYIVQEPGLNAFLTIFNDI